MPFVSQAQRAACYAQQSRDLKAGRIPKWKCHEFEHGIHSKKRNPRRQHKAKKRKVHIGPRGGRYVMFKRRKVYI
jgi:hypothetical protein